MSTIYSDKDVCIQVTVVDTDGRGPVHIVVEKPTTNPDKRFQRHVMNFYVIEEIPDRDPKAYKVRKDFDEDNSITLRIGRIISDDPQIDESNKELYFWDPKAEDKDKEWINLKEYVAGAGEYREVYQRFNDYDAYVEVVIKREWGDPNMGW